MNDCFDISNLPNYKQDCWLNAILVSILYSQYSRDLLINASVNWKNDIFLNIIRNIIYSYYSNNKNANLYYQSIIPAKLLYEIIIKGEKRNKHKYYWQENHIIDFYNFLDIDCADIIYIRDREKDRYIMDYLSKRVRTSYLSEQPPKVLVLFHQDFTSIPSALVKSKDRISKYLIDTSKINVGTIATCEDEIVFMGITYVLSSCIYNNSEEGYKYHAISGIFCNNKKLVYNSYLNTTETPCALINYNWDIKKDEEYCLNPNDCKLNLNLNIKKINDLCFNFGKGNRTLIYVQKNKTNVTLAKLKHIELSEYTPEPIVSEISDEIKKIKEMSTIALYYEIENITNKHIDVNDLQKIGNRDIIEKIVLESKLKALLLHPPSHPIVVEELPKEPDEPPPKTEGGNNKYTKNEIIIMINKKISKLNKNKLTTLYSKL